MTKRRLGASYHKLFISTVISNVGDGMSTIAYPWLASAITRNPILISLVVLVQRLPWLVFTLPAGVITDRVDRKRAMVIADFARFGLTLVVALAVLAKQSGLPGPNELAGVHGTQTGLYIVLLCATLLLGTGEVLRDNCGQTFMPSIVDNDQLEVANGRMWSAEGIANTFVGPPLGSLLLLAAFALPFFVDAASFFAAAALVLSIPGSFRAERPEGHVQAPWRSELAEGFRWLWANELLRSMAIILGFMNLASTLSGSVLVLFSQEILKIGPLVFTIMGFGFAAGGTLGANTAPWLAKRIGSGTCLALTLASSSLMSFVVGLSSLWPVVMVMFAIGATLGASWNVITVSLRQSIIPPHLLGRVNSVYRFFAWGMMPVGAALGGITVTVVSHLANRRIALRSVFFLDSAIYACLFIAGRRRLTTEKLEAAARDGACLSSVWRTSRTSRGSTTMPLGENLTEQSILAERAKVLVPLLDQEAEYADTHGQLSPTVVEALHREGLLKLWVPEKLGGAELDPVHSLEVLENLSYGDASAGWVTMAANLSIGTAGAYLSDMAVAELWGDGRQPVIAGQGTRPGTAKTVAGGHSLSGSWSFGSGLKHSSHVHSLGIIEETGEPRIFVTPIDAVNLIDNWDVLGLCGTGSIDYTMDSVFVPDGWSHFAVTTVPERGGSLYGLGIIGFAVTCHSGWAMGVGRRMLDELAALAHSKSGRPGAQADNAAFQQGFAQAEAGFRAARALVLEAFTDLSKSLYAGDEISVRQHTLIRLALANITKELHEVASFVYLAGGTTALRHGTLQRLYRDVHAGTQHVTSGPAVWQTCGRELIGTAEGQRWQFLDLVDPH